MPSIRPASSSEASAAAVAVCSHSAETCRGLRSDGSIFPPPLPKLDSGVSGWLLICVGCSPMDAMTRLTSSTRIPSTLLPLTATSCAPTGTPSADACEGGSTRMIAILLPPSTSCTSMPRAPAPNVKSVRPGEPATARLSRVPPFESVAGVDMATGEGAAAEAPLLMCEVSGLRELLMCEVSTWLDGARLCELPIADLCRSSRRSIKFFRVGMSFGALDVRKEGGGSPRPGIAPSVFAASAPLLAPSARTTSRLGSSIRTGCRD